MPSGDGHPRDKRYDCFISFHGSQALTDLGFNGPGLDCDVRELAGKVHNRLLKFPRRPSVFFDEKEIVGHWPDYLSNAVLQLRGGGVALVLVTAEYLASKYCLAELRAFLEMERFIAVDGCECEAIAIRVVVLELNKRTVPEALQDVDIKGFIGTKFGKIQRTQLQADNRRTCPLVVKAICEQVENIWNGKEVLCLGRNIGDCVEYLARFFHERDCHLIARKLGIDLEKLPQGMSVRSIFDKALGQGKFSSPYYLAELSNADLGETAKLSLAAFQSKWCSSSWEWSLAPKDNDICLTQFLSDADDALCRLRRPGAKRKLIPQCENGGASAATKSAKVGRTDASTDIFRSFFLPQSQLDSALLPDVSTCLAQLKSEVLQGTYSGDGSPDRRQVALISITGEGGVGKTSACKLLCADENVQAHFEGAIWIQLGQNAIETEVVDELRKAVSFCGGKLAAKEIQSMDNVPEAVQSACEFFSGHKLLFIVDNVWGTPAGSLLKSWTDTLSKITNFPGSAIIVTTRFRDLARSPGIFCVELKRLDVRTEGRVEWHIAKTLYDKFVKETAVKQACDSYKKIRRKALRLSCGLPLGITTFAGLVHSHSTTFDDAGGVLKLIEDGEIGLASEDVGEDHVTATGHDGLYKAMEACLSYLDNRKGQKFAVESERRSRRGTEVRSDSLSFRASYDAFPDCFFSARYAALEVMPASTPRLSFQVLRRLWHVSSVQVIQIATYFANIGLGKIEDGGGSGPEEKDFVLHDLQYEFSKGFYRSGNESVDGHALLLSSCHDLMVYKYGKSGAPVWAQFCFQDLQLPDASLRDYLSNNLIRHLCSAVSAEASSSLGERMSYVAALKQELFSLLFNFRWLCGRFYALGGRNAVLRDFASALEPEFLCQSDAYSLRWLKNIAMLTSEDTLSRSDGTIASFLVQMVQSVEAKHPASNTAFLKQLSKEAHEEVHGAWLNPISRCCLPFERRVLKATATTNSSVDFVSSLGDGKHFVAFSANGMVRIYDVFTLEAELVLESIRDITCISVVQQGCASVSPIIFSADTDGTVRRSPISFNEAGRVSKSNSVLVGQSKPRPTVLFASKDGKFVAVGCSDSSVCVWEQSGVDLDIYEQKVRLLCSTDEKRDYSVLSLVVSGSGDFVAASTNQAEFYIWREGIGILERVPKNYFYLSNRTLPMFLSSDETSLAVLCSTPIWPAYFVCDVSSSDNRSSDFKLPELDFFTCASLADNSGAWDFGRSLLVGGVRLRSQTGEGYCLLEYTIEDELKMVRRCRLSSKPKSVCRADCNGETGLSWLIVGDADGSVSVLGADSFDDSQKMHLRKSGMKEEEEISQLTSPELTSLTAVAVMPNTSLVVAGHWDGRLSLWSAEDGSYQKVIDSAREVGSVQSINIGGEESVIATGHSNGVAIVCEVLTWTVRFALKYDWFAAKSIEILPVRVNKNRSFPKHRKVVGQHWNLETGFTSLTVEDSGASINEKRTKQLSFVSSDSGHLLWVTNYPLDGKEGDEPWEAIVIDAGDGRDIFKSGKHRNWEALRAEVELELSRIAATASWKKSVEREDNLVCELPDTNENSGSFWEIAVIGRFRVQCASRSMGGELSGMASILFESPVSSIAAQWLPDSGKDGRRRAVVACSIDENRAPSILHFIAPKV